ncbi:MAG TPA: 4-alpha-glucanotransferase, partial [bacterium]
YAGGDGSNIADALIRLAHSSVADLAIVPLQDVLRLGSSARMNLPGTASGNWGWRFAPDALRPALADGLGRVTEGAGRAAPGWPKSALDR